MCSLLYILIGGIFCINFGRHRGLTQRTHFLDKNGPLYRSSLDGCGDSTKEWPTPLKDGTKSIRNDNKFVKNGHKSVKNDTKPVKHPWKAGYIHSPERVLLVDATGLAYRCFFALPELKTHRGTDIACLMGFMNTLSRLHRLYYPKYLGIVFDSPGANNPKREIWPEYKKNRQVVSDSFRTQLTWIREFCAILGLPVFIEKSTEADDVITSMIGFLRGGHDGSLGASCKPLRTVLPERSKGIFDRFEERLRSHSLDNGSDLKGNVPEEPSKDSENIQGPLNVIKGGYDVTVVTSDKDLLQILSHNGTGDVNVRIVQPHKAYRVVTEQTVRTEYGMLNECATSRHEDGNAAGEL